MNLDTLIDFANDATLEIAKHKFEVTLSPGKLMAKNYAIPTLDWNSIPYGEDEIDQVPADKRGIYAFAVSQNDDVLPPHGYILYMGIAGRKSKRPLRERYRDYLNVKKVRKRERIARMIGTWHEVLWFLFAPVDDDVSTEELEELERQLNTALLPPFSEGDLEADTKSKRRAFR